MKPLFFVLLILCFISSCGVFENEQNKIEGCSDSFSVVSSMPQLQGGLAKLQQKVVYPKEAMEKGIEGRVTLGFIVNKDGDPIQIKLIRGIGHGTFEASKKTLLDAKFTPDLHNDEPVCVQYSLPIVFRLGN